MKDATPFPCTLSTVNMAQSIDGLCGFGFVQQALL